MPKIITNNEQETFDFAMEYAKNMKGGEIIGLSGDLGSGKTIFSKGLATALGVRKNVNSPTFVIMKIYKTEENIKIKNFCHIDAYRVGSQDLESIGAFDYIGDKNTISVIEWIENVNIKNLKFIKIKISLINKYKREIKIN